MHSQSSRTSVTNRCSVRHLGSPNSIQNRSLGLNIGPEACQDFYWPVLLARPPHFSWPDPSLLLARPLTSICQIRPRHVRPCRAVSAPCRSVPCQSGPRKVGIDTAWSSMLRRRSERGLVWSSLNCPIEVGSFQ